MGLLRVTWATISVSQTDDRYERTGQINKHEKRGHQEEDADRKRASAKKRNDVEVSRCESREFQQAQSSSADENKSTAAVSCVSGTRPISLNHVLLFGKTCCIFVVPICSRCFGWFSEDAESWGHEVEAVGVGACSDHQWHPRVAMQLDTSCGYRGKVVDARASSDVK